ncbi:flippase [Sulfurimonas diazotrophicus]|uniref:Flippase n=1 Tax=Sulfurimonas diazotrophicus TaxID=3131939 RepID=A0ABZ3H8G6_9BACT
MNLKLRNRFNFNKHFKEIIRGSILAFSAKVLATGFGLISSLIIARYYGPDVVGIVAIINSILLIFGIVGLMGHNTSILRLIPEYTEKHSETAAYIIYNKTRLIVFMISICAGIVLFISSSFIAEYIFHKDYLQEYFLIAAPFIVISTLNILNTDTLRAIQKIDLFALMQLIPSIITLILLIVTTVVFYNRDNPVYIIFATSLITALILFYIIRSTFKGRVSKNHSTVPQIKKAEIFSLSFPMFLTAVMHLVISQTDIIMLGIMRNETDVGIYAITLKMALLTSFILNAINSMAAPKFSQLYHSNNLEDLKEVAQKSSKLIFWMTLPLILVYIFAGHYVLSIFGESFSRGYYALIFLSIGQFINAAAGSVGYFLDMTGDQKIFQNIVIFAAALNIILNFLLIPSHGIEGAAFASMTSMIFWNILASVYIKRKHGFYISYIPSLRGRK